MKATDRTSNSAASFQHKLLGILLLGLLLRFALLLLAMPVELQSDEANYVFLALGLERFGIYFDCYRYLWPPLYPGFLRLCFFLADEQGLLLARVIQVLSTVSIGWSCMAIARRLFNDRIALVTGVLWVLHLPLASYSHLLWSESLSLALWGPALALLIAASHDPGHPARGLRLLGYALLAGISVHLKESNLYLTPLLLLPLAWTLRCQGIRLVEILRVVSLPLLLFALVILPWSLRNLEVYGRLTVASTLGENVYNGLNATHRNFDLIPVNTTLQRRGLPILKVREPMRGTSSTHGDLISWPRAEEELNLPLRLDANRRQGLEFAQANPVWFLKARMQKLSDLVAPVSFLTRHLTLGHYPSSLAQFRVPLVLWSVAAAALTLLLGIIGLGARMPASPAAGIFALQGAYYLATGSLVAMSRFRLPLVPILLIGCASLICLGLRGITRPRMALCAAGTLCLLALWVLGSPTTLGLLRAALGGLEASP